MDDSLRKITEKYNDEEIKNAASAGASYTHLLDLVSAEFLQEMCDSISASLGFPSYILDAAGVPLTEISGYCDLCDLIRSSEKGATLCKHSTSNLCIAARDKKGMVLAPCETIGLYNAALPIFVSGRHMGSWIAGRIHINNSISADNIRALSEKLALDEKAALEAFSSTAVRNSEDIPSIFKVLKPYVSELSDYVHRRFLLMHEAEHLAESHELITKNLLQEQRVRETADSLHMVLNTLKDTVYVIDQKTYEVVYADVNFDGRDALGSRGVSCFRLLGKDTICACCGLDMIRDQPVGASYRFETNERVPGLWHSINVTSMEWPGGRPVFLVAVRDITEEKQLQAELVDAATFDLTLNIPTLGRLTARLDKLLGEGGASGFLFIIDINNFKLIGNAYGHSYNDALLEEITRFLKSSITKHEYVYRYATKTFAVLYEGADEEQKEEFIKTLQQRFVNPWTIQDKSCFLTFSTAIVPYSSEDGRAADVMRNADIALDKAIDRNRNNFYTLNLSHIDDDYAERVALVNDMYAMIQNDFAGLFAHYQPVFDVNENKIIYVEALMRWEHPDKGFIPPLKFIELAERSSLIGPLSERLMDMALSQCRKWQRKQPELKLCVNFSVALSYQEGVVERISQMLKKHEFAPENLIIEINERDTVSDQAGMFEFMRRLQEMGCGVSLDDFGSGMSSMNRLRSIPVDYIKIDRCFVANIQESEYDRAIIGFLANLPLDVQMVCEGIETQEQLDIVKGLGINICQGYFLSRPLPPERLPF